MRIITSFVICIFMLFLALPITVYAEENSLMTEVGGQLDELLEDNGIELSFDDAGDITLENIAEMIRSRIGWSRLPFRSIAANIGIVIVLTAVLGAAGGIFNSGSLPLNSSVSVISAASVLFPLIYDIYGQALEAVRTSAGFIAVFIPVFAGIAAAEGNIASAGIYDIMVIGAVELIVQLSSALLIPLLNLVTILSVTGSIFRKTDISRITSLLSKLTVWGLTAAMTLFTGFLTLKCSLAGKADGAASKTVRFFISGSVPVVGGAVNDAYSAVRSSLELIGATAGTIGCIAVAVILLPPLIHIIVFRGGLWIMAALSELFEAEAVNKLLKAVDGGLSIAQALLVSCGMMFILSTGIIMKISG